MSEVNPRKEESVKARFRLTRWKALPMAALMGAGTVIAATAIAGAGDVETKSEHWGVIARNTIGSPVAELRDGPYGTFKAFGDAAQPPFGKGSLGIAVANNSTTLSPPSEKAAFGNEVDFRGENTLSMTQAGFHVFQTGENVGYGGASNLPNITLEIDANLNALPADDYTSMVWVPNGTGLPVDQWTGYIDATSNGYWYFTGAEAGATGCTQAGTCNFTQAMTALNDGGATPVTYTYQVAKGRDNMWIGAVDGARYNGKIYDFEADGVKMKAAK
jgi:hypothetical protein